MTPSGSDAAAAGRPVIVQKYGGTSVATPEGRVALAGRVREARDSGHDVVVVVSAMGRKGAPYATDTLLGLLEGHDPVPRESDMLAACGEVISAIVVAHELRAAGIAAAAMTGADAGVLTDDAFGAATVLAVEPGPLLSALSRGVVPVVTGFQGVTRDGDVTTLGRGGSDTTACAVGVALAADSVEIYTDVDGVMTADPRTCETARVLDALQYEELFQMAKHGAKVMHAPAAEAAMEGGVPVWVRNARGESRGTLIADAERLVEERRARIATAVTHSDGVARLSVAVSEDDDPGARMRALTRVFRRMADAEISLDMFTPYGGSLVFSVPEGDLPAAMAALDRLALPYEVETGLGKVTLVGAGMHGVPGVMARVAEALAEAGVDVLQVADSHYTISVLVRREVVRDAIAALHDEFGLGEQAPS